jgi:hypothetical protein
VRLVSRTEPPDSIEPTTVDDMHSERDGVWWPDGLAPEMAWHGIPSQRASAPAVNEGFPTPFNPWAPTGHGSLVLAYTAQLPEGALLAGILLRFCT